eukprot:gene6861-7633_t
MSFSKSSSKRFADIASDAPPVGSYDIAKVKAKAHGSIVFEKEARFKDKKDQTPGPADTQPILCTELSLNASAFSNQSFAIPTSTPLKKKNRILSSSTYDLVSKEEFTNRIRHLEYKTNELEKHLQWAKKENLTLARTVENSVKKDFSLCFVRIQIMEVKLSAIPKQQLTNERDEKFIRIDSLQLESEESYKKREELLQQEHEKKCKELQSNCERNEATLLDMKSQLEEKENVCEELRINANCLTQQFETAKKENDCLKDNVFNLEKSIEQLEIQVSNLTTELHKVRKEKANLDEQMECLENTTTENLRSLTLKFEELEDEHEALQKEFGEKEAVLNAELELTKASNKNMVDDYNTINNAYKVLRSDYSTLTSEADELSEKCQEMQRSSIEAEEKYTETIQKLELQNSEAAKQKLKYETEICMITHALESKDSELLVQCEENESLQRVNEEKAKDEEILFRRVDRLGKQLESYEQKIKEIKEEHKGEMSVKDEMIVKIKDELERRLVETQTKLSAAELAFRSKFEEQEMRYNQLAVDTERLKTTSGLDAVKKEVELWRNKFDDLQLKIKPFQSQLEQFENERLILLSENNFKESEIAKLAERYAQILGHQNNKQKIHHVIKLKEENLILKKDVTKLRAQLVKEKKSNKNASPKLHSKFDRTRAFQHSGKENQIP